MGQWQNTGWRRLWVTTWHFCHPPPPPPPDPPHFCPLSWSDVLLGELPNVYVYACNNPSESIIAKRRGYGTIVSHNVPPYGRAGLYKQMAVLRELLGEFRGAPAGEQGVQARHALKGPIIDALEVTGLQVRGVGKGEGVGGTCRCERARELGGKWDMCSRYPLLTRWRRDCRCWVGWG